MRALLLALATVVLGSSALAATPIWENEAGCQLYWAGYFHHDRLPETYVQLGLLMPDDCYCILEDEGSIELNIKGVGWTGDIGVSVDINCETRDKTDWKTTAMGGHLTLTSQFACPWAGQKILLMFRLPWRKFLNNKRNPIIDVRFLNGRFYRENNQGDSDLPVSASAR